MSARRSVNKGRSVALFVMFLFFLSVLINWGDVKITIKTVIESDIPQICLWGYVIALAIVHRVCVGSQENTASFVYSQFGKYADTIFTIGTYGISGSTSLSLLKGLFLQFFFGKQFFIGFNEFDLSTMFLLSSFLLVYCIFSTMKMFREIIYQSEAVDVIPQ